MNVLLTISKIFLLKPHHMDKHTSGSSQGLLDSQFDYERVAVLLYKFFIPVSKPVYTRCLSTKRYRTVLNIKLNY